MNQLTRHSIRLEGCRPTPLSSYLKALGILRIVARQVDEQARGWWEHDAFWLRSTLDPDALTTFFLEEYRPSPILAPWNGGSGFYSTDNRKAIEAIERSTAERFAPYRQVIALCRDTLQALGLTAKPTEDKFRLLTTCRNTWPDDALVWLDAAFLLTADAAKYPPLLGTGGNDGRLEFTNNLMQRLVELIDPESGAARESSPPQLREVLFDAISAARTTTRSPHRTSSRARIAGT